MTANEMGAKRSMVTELARIDIKAGSRAKFEEDFAALLPDLQAAKGCLSAQLHRSVEVADRYWLMVRWQHIDNHLIDLAESPLLSRWVAMAQRHFAADPQVEHLSPLA